MPAFIVCLTNFATSDDGYSSLSIYFVESSLPNALESMGKDSDDADSSNPSLLYPKLDLFQHVLYRDVS